MRGSLTSELGIKCNVICDAYSDYTPENRTMGGMYNTRNVPARATRHFAVPKVENDSEEAHIECVTVAIL